jgi:hypothetical protein
MDMFASFASFVNLLGTVKRSQMRRMIQSLVLLSGVTLANPAQAVVCGLTGGSIFPQSGTCAEVYAGVFSSGVGFEGTSIPPNYGFSPTGGSAATIAGGNGVDANATAIADMGLLRLTANASTLGGVSGSFARARAAAAFSDNGTIAMPGGIYGQLVHAFVTVFIEGSHSLIAGFGPDVPHLNVGNIYNVDYPNGVYAFDAQIGDFLTVSLGMQIYADASPANPLQFAAYGNTIHLFFDFVEPGAYYNSVSGHDYSSAAITPPAVPLPAAFPLFAVGLGALGFAGWRKWRNTAA